MPGSFVSLRLPSVVPAPRAGRGHRVAAVRAALIGGGATLLPDVLVLDGGALAGEEKDGPAPARGAHVVELDGFRRVPVAELGDVAHHVEVLSRHGGEAVDGEVHPDGLGGVARPGGNWRSEERRVG